ncbi:MAG: B12-binding domain-containing protein [SAR324 cluster bacterium]|jgi:methanogenic corrinoid protein MtbC1|nr:B12-binding domain-containing protein [SAR324 cluster bacterium]MDP7140221.1 B12-binding domain-containing protein [SAR324 cluster bacterium]
MSASEQKEELLDQLYDQTIEGKAEPVRTLTEELLKQGVAPNEILFNGLIPALEEVGRMFEEGTYFVPEMLVAA